MKYIKLILILTICYLSFGCSGKVKQIEFDKEKWNKRSDFLYEYREAMVEDLMANYLREGMDFNEMITLIGKPTNYGNLDQNTVGYEVMVHYGWDIDPVETKTLIIELTSDSLVSNYHIEHWKR